MISTMVPGFTGSTEIDLPVPFSYDLQIASTRYFSSLDEGEIPLLLLFSGTIFGQATGGSRCSRCRGARRPRTGCRSACGGRRWTCTSRTRAWITMSRQTLDELIRFKTRHALPTWDATVAALLAQAGQEES